MIDFDLGDAHPKFQRLIPEILLPLRDRYPGAKLSSVGVYQPRRGDTSMGATTSDGKITLNAYWFARDPAELSKAARRYAIIDATGFPMGWHGPMIAEPPQLLTHEFGHCVYFGLPEREIEEWSEERWRAATRRPELAPSGYALTSPPEFFGEMFALCELGLATSDEVAALDEATRRIR